MTLRPWLAILIFAVTALFTACTGGPQPEPPSVGGHSQDAAAGVANDRCVEDGGVDASCSTDTDGGSDAAHSDAATDATDDSGG